MLNTLLDIVYPLIFIAGGVFIVIRFRGSPGAILGGIAFGVWLASNLSRIMLNALDVAWYDYNYVYIVLNLAAWGCLLAAIITGRTVTRGAVSYEISGGANQSALPPAHPELSGIGGWLILPAIGFVLTPIISVFGLALGVVMFADMADQGLGGVWVVELLVQVGMLAFIIYAAVRFFGKKGDAPMLIIALMIANLAASGLLLVIELGAGAEEMATQTGLSLVQATIAAAIWIPYFRVSKRVTATFVN